MLNVEATLGLWLLRNMNNWKKLVKGLIQRPLNPVESLLMSWWALLWALYPPAPETPAEGCKRPDQLAAQHPPAERSPATARVRRRAGICLGARDGDGPGSGAWDFLHG